MATIFPLVETAPSNNLGGNSRPDADDPAIYYNQNNPAASIVIGTQKNAGLTVYDLNGNELQVVNPGNIRYNNVDLIYNFNLGSEQVDLAIASERNNDSLSIFKINSGSQSLSDLTASELTNADFSIFGVDDGTRGAYGLAAYKSVVDGKSYVFVTQNDGNAIAQLELAADGAGNVTASVVRTLTIPNSGGKAEGLVIDRDNGTLYVGQENFGIYRFNAEVNGGNSYEVVDRVNDGSGVLQSDVEGLTIDYDNNYLIASSQGNDSFVIYDRFGGNQLVDTFRIGNRNGIDGVQATDGIDILNRNLGGDFSAGILVVQDGQNENDTTNFKYLSVADLANGSEPEPELDLETELESEPVVNEVADDDTIIQIGFQSGDDYGETVDTFVREASSNADNSNSAFLDVDGSDNSLEVESLLRFENIFDSGEGEGIPENAEIVSAQLELNITDEGDGLQFHRMLQNWSDTDTWDSLDNGITADGVEANASADAVTGSVSTGLLSVDVTNSVQAWQEDPQSNYGWAILHTGTDGVDFNASEGFRPPNLIVEYSLGEDSENLVTTVDSEM